MHANQMALVHAGLVCGYMVHGLVGGYVVHVLALEDNALPSLVLHGCCRWASSTVQASRQLWQVLQRPRCLGQSACRATPSRCAAVDMTSKEEVSGTFGVGGRWQWSATECITVLLACMAVAVWRDPRLQKTVAILHS